MAFCLILLFQLTMASSVVVVAVIEPLAIDVVAASSSLHLMGWFLLLFGLVLVN